MDRKFISSVLVLSLMMGSANIGVNEVNAKESSQTQQAKINLQHLTWSLKNNYLGLKNQGTWEQYIKNIRAKIAQIPGSESKIKTEFTQQVDRCASMVMGLARVNQVEKSMEVNAHVMRNVPTWEEYIRLAEIDLAKVDRNEFTREVKELEMRIEIVKLKIKAIKEKDKQENSGSSNGSNSELEKILKELQDKIKDLEGKITSGGGSSSGGGSTGGNDSIFEKIIKDLQDKIKELENKLNNGGSGSGNGDGTGGTNPGGGSGGNGNGTDIPNQQKSAPIAEEDIHFEKQADGKYDIQIDNLSAGDTVYIYKRPYDYSPLATMKIEDKTQQQARAYSFGGNLLDLDEGLIIPQLRLLNGSTNAKFNAVDLNVYRYSAYVSRIEAGKAESDRTESVYDTVRQQEVESGVGDIKDKIENGEGDGITKDDLENIVGEDGKDLITDENKEDIIKEIPNMQEGVNAQDELLRIIKQIIAVNLIESVEKGGDASYISLNDLKDAVDDRSIVKDANLEKYRLQISDASDTKLNNKGKIANMIKAIEYLDKIKGLTSENKSSLELTDILGAVSNKSLVSIDNIEQYRDGLADKKLDTIEKVEKAIELVNTVVKIESVPKGGDASHINIEDLNKLVSGVNNDNIDRYRDAISKAEDGALNSIDKIQGIVNSVNQAVEEDKQQEEAKNQAKQQLQAKIVEIEGLNKNKYTSESWTDSNIDQVATNSKGILSNFNSTKNDYLNAIQNLETAKSLLVVKTIEEDTEEEIQQEMIATKSNVNQKLNSYVYMDIPTIEQGNVTEAEAIVYDTNGDILLKSSKLSVGYNTARFSLGELEKYVTYDTNNEAELDIQVKLRCKNRAGEINVTSDKKNTKIKFKKIRSKEEIKSSGQMNVFDTNFSIDSTDGITTVGSIKVNKDVKLEFKSSNDTKFAIQDYTTSIYSEGSIILGSNVSIKQALNTHNEGEIEGEFSGGCLYNSGNIKYDISKVPFNRTGYSTIYNTGYLETDEITSRLIVNKGDLKYSWYTGHRTSSPGIIHNSGNIEDSLRGGSGSEYGYIYNYVGAKFKIVGKGTNYLRSPVYNYGTFDVESYVRGFKGHGGMNNYGKVGIGVNADAMFGGGVNNTAGSITVLGILDLDDQMANYGDIYFKGSKSTLKGSINNSGTVRADLGSPLVDSRVINTPVIRQ